MALVAKARIERRLRDGPPGQQVAARPLQLALQAVGMRRQPRFSLENPQEVPGAQARLARQIRKSHPFMRRIVDALACAAHPA
jgi:hypothetical protein